METQIDRDSRLILRLLASKPRDEFVPAEDIAMHTNLSSERVNDAVARLVDSGYAEWIRTFGTAPFDFADGYITSRGRYEDQRLDALDATARSEERGKASSVGVSPNGVKPALLPTPAGSPYGFTDEDWEIVSRHKARLDRLYVVLGHQFSSGSFHSENLRKNIEQIFELAVQRHNDGRRVTTPVKLKFSVLAAGYGEHLFNQIARGIIGSDVAVFETSDLNANVMLEMGVALTWGVRVLPIKAEGKPTPPSDVSGQTCGVSGPDHEGKVVAMIERALRKKGPAV
jgi:hypothetical protein